MQKSLKKIIAISIIFIFSTFIMINFIIYPEIGEKVLYGKRGLEKNQHLEYSEIIISGNYACMESAAISADDNLPRFVKEFNECNNK